MSKKFYLFIIIIAILFVPVFVVHAQYGIDITADQTPITDFKGASLQTMVGNLLGGILSLVGILFFALMVYGGVIWMSAAGNQEREKKAGGIMIGATIGVVLVLSSYVLVSFLFKTAGESLNTSTNKKTVTITTTTIENNLDESESEEDEEGEDVKQCEPKTGVDLSDFCGGLEPDVCEGNVCVWLDDECTPAGEHEQLCSSQTENDPCESDVYADFGSICEWK